MRKAVTDCYYSTFSKRWPCWDERHGCLLVVLDDGADRQIKALFQYPPFGTAVGHVQRQVILGNALHFQVEGQHFGAAEGGIHHQQDPLRPKRLQGIPQFHQHVRVRCLARFLRLVDDGHVPNEHLALVNLAEDRQGDVGRPRDACRVALHPRVHRHLVIALQGLDDFFQGVADEPMIGSVRQVRLPRVENDKAHACSPDAAPSGCVSEIIPLTWRSAYSQRQAP